MKILLINKSLYPKGGDAVSTLTTGVLLVSKGHHVNYWGMNHPLNPDYPFKNYFVENVDYHALNSYKKKMMMAVNLLYSFKAKRKLEKLFKEFKPDIVHLNNFAHQISPSILHVLKKYDIPSVMTMRDYKLVCAPYNMLLNGKPCEKCKDGKYYQCLINKCVQNSFSKSLLNTMEMYFHHNILHLYDLIDTYISPSIFLKAKCEEMGLKKQIEYLPNFVNLTEFTPQYKEEENTIVYFGRLSNEKGLVTLIEAMKGINATLRLIGDGPSRNDLEAMVRSEKNNNVEFLGFKTGDELKGLIRQSMFVVLPSEWYENNPRTIIEAFALGKPAIGARIGGIPELVKDNETGLTFEPGNADDLAEKIGILLRDDELRIRMGKNARDFAERELNTEKHYQRLMELYNMAIEKNALRK
ncbi:MAG: glycosyltransferase family 4 protein [Nitrospirae bacterium]|nr:glycosyltransferase family 4 protein [Nitrospirota bacterium]